MKLLWLCNMVPGKVKEAVSGGSTGGGLWVDSVLEGLLGREDLNIRILREFTRYRYKLVSMKSSEKNRFQNAFTVCNVALDSVVSDMFGKSATAITDYLTSDESFDAEHCVSLLQRSLKKKAEKVLESIEGYSISDEQKARIKIIREHYDFVEKLIAKVDTCVNEMVEKYEGV